MDRVSKIARLVFSAAALLLAISAFVFVMKYDTRPAHAVGTLPGATSALNLVYTQSDDGKTLYQWGWITAQKKWMRWEYQEKAPLK